MMCDFFAFIFDMTGMKGGGEGSNPGHNFSNGRRPAGELQYMGAPAGCIS